MSYWLTSEEKAAKFASLVGRKVESVWVEKSDQGELRLVCDEGVFALPTEGDCCSQSWWADVVGVKQLVGATVAKFEEIEMPEVPDGDTRTRQEYDSQYGVRVTTDRGVCDLIFRNSSNGYYGGSCGYEWGAPPDEDFEQITEDWSA